MFRTLILALQTARRENLKAQNLPLPIPKSTANWSRRKFMTTAATVGAVGLTAGSLGFSKPANATGNQPTIAIIGGGIAGLNAAYQLKKAGYLATVYEARSRIGGRMYSKDFGNGLIVDLGGELVNTDHADMLTLAQELNIGLFNRADDMANFPEVPKSAYFFNGANISETQLVIDLALIVEQINIDAALLDLDWDTYAPKFDKLSVADYLDLHADKISVQPYIKELFKDVIRSEYGSEADKSSALQLLFVLPVIDGQAVDLISYSDEVYSVVGGSAQITDALCAQLEHDQIELEQELKAIKQSAGAGKYQLTFNEDHKVEADIVIVAVPFPALKNVKISAALPKLLRRFIDETSLGSNEKLLGSFSERFWRKDTGFSGEAWSDLGFCVMWDAAQRQPERTDSVINFFLGGNQTQSLENPTLSYTDLGNQFVANFNNIVSGANAASTGQFIRSGWTKSRFTTGGYVNYQPGQLTKFGGLFWIESDNPDEQQQVNVGNLIFAGEHLSDAFYGFMNGGAQTGRLAAQLALSQLASLA